jgi:hypothetical protein
MAVGWSPAGSYSLTSRNGMPPCDLAGRAGRCGAHIAGVAAFARSWMKAAETSSTPAGLSGERAMRLKVGAGRGEG